MTTHIYKQRQVTKKIHFPQTWKTIQTWKGSLAPKVKYKLFCSTSCYLPPHCNFLFNNFIIIAPIVSRPVTNAETWLENKLWLQNPSRIQVHHIFPIDREKWKFLPPKFYQLVNKRKFILLLKDSIHSFLFCWWLSTNVNTFFISFPAQSFN